MRVASAPAEKITVEKSFFTSWVTKVATLSPFSSNNLGYSWAPIVWKTLFVRLLTTSRPEVVAWRVTLSSGRELINSIKDLAGTATAPSSSIVARRCVWIPISKSVLLNWTFPSYVSIRIVLKIGSWALLESALLRRDNFLWRIPAWITTFIILINCCSSVYGNVEKSKLNKAYIIN